MAKYYVQSGKVSYIVCACDTEGAALWVMHRIMDDKICDFEEAKAEWEEESLHADANGLIDDGNLVDDHLIPMGVPQAIPYDAMLDGLAEFDEKIKISEQGFGRNEADELETEDIFHQWRQLMLAVDRLQDEQM